MEKRLYKKIMTRSLSLISIRCWYLSDKEGLSKCTDNTFFFEPLFVHEEGKGVSVYYDFTDKKQDPHLLLPYFYENQSKFFNLKKEYEKDCEEILQLVKNDDKKEFEKVFYLLLKTWPMLAICNTIGAMSGADEYKTLIKTAYDLRVKFDTVVYKAEEFLLKIVKDILKENEAFSDYVFPEEIVQDKIPSKEILNARKRRYIYYNGIFSEEFDLKDFCEKNLIEFDEEKLVKQNTIKGTVACKGKIKGRVAIIFENSQINKVKRGDILVTPMTTPDFLPAMKKAAAFVTDEGGVTCHAAIVARELKKPCIIGTKVATQVLKDGDLVDVDADNGVVRILNEEK